jgi:tRNA-Thr(GGU) m(6)t(6)A37 methyltransferase TsaA
MKIVYEPIGIVRSPFTEPEGVPIQPWRGRGLRARVDLLPELADGLRDLDGFSHIILVCHLHRSVGFSLQVVPFLDDVARGLFATRAPRRPNPIGLSVVRLVAVEGARVEFEGVDLIDGTPVLDIKPYVPEIEDGERIRLGWLEHASRTTDVSDRRFVRDACDGENA